jgi:hypothetical protein
LPFLIRQFPLDQEVEVLRSNLRASKASSHNAWDPSNGLEALLEEPVEEEALGAFVDPAEQRRLGNADEKAAEIIIPSFRPDTVMATEEQPFMAQATTHVSSSLPEETDKTSSWEVPPSPLKRKGEELASGASKRVEKGKEVVMPIQPVPIKEQVREDGDNDDSDSDSGKSVEIDMTFDDEDEDEGDNDME